MNYRTTIDYLFAATPMFQQIGAAAYKPGLDTARALDDAFDNPHRKFRTIHVAGTNGKGSTCHTLAAILQREGYRVGLFTSPHLVDFRERIRVNGEMIPEEAVVDFVERYRAMGLQLEPSFFELTTIMAFDWFARAGVDFAVIETGLGGRLDTTNIITPMLCAITNISFDHMAQLGSTLKSIAREKAGIIKPGVPVVIGQNPAPEVRKVFEDVAKAVEAPIVFALQPKPYMQARTLPDGIIYEGTPMGDFIGQLDGACQPENTATVIRLVQQLRSLGVEISDAAVRRGFGTVVQTTGLFGRWMKVAADPLTICDTGHNAGGWEYLGKTLARYGNRLSMVIGFVNDKDVSHILDMMPREATYFFTQASVRRALPAEQLAELAAEHGLQGSPYPDVPSALEAAHRHAAQLKAAATEPVIFVGGSTFIVADLLTTLRAE